MLGLSAQPRTAQFLGVKKMCTFLDRNVTASCNLRLNVGDLRKKTEKVCASVRLSVQPVRIKDNLNISEKENLALILYSST